MLKNEKLSNGEVVIVYKDDVVKLLKYVSWLERMNGQNTSNIYTGEGIEETSMPVPVYDSMLLSFVREAKTTIFGSNGNTPDVSSDDTKGYYES